MYQSLQEFNALIVATASEGLAKLLSRRRGGVTLSQEFDQWGKWENMLVRAPFFSLRRSLSRLGSRYAILFIAPVVGTTTIYCRLYNIRRILAAVPRESFH